MSENIPTPDAEELGRMFADATYDDADPVTLANPATAGDGVATSGEADNHLTTAEGMPGADAHTAAPGEDEGLSGEVIPAPGPAEDVEARVPRVIDHRDDTPSRPRAFVNGKRQPLLPDWLTSRDSFAATVRHQAGYVGHVAGFHLVRVPVYALRVAARAPFGAGRLTRAMWRWVADSDSVEVRRSLLASANDPRTFLRLEKQRTTQFRTRLVAALGGVAAVGTSGAVVATTAPVEVQALTAAAALGLLGFAGRRREARMFDSATVSAKAPPLTSDLIREALAVLGIGSLSGVKKDPDAIRFVSPIVRDGAGYRADIDLPPGATASQVMEKRDQLASGLRRPLGCVWPGGDPDVHTGRLVLYVADRSLSQSKPVAWPLAAKGAANLFDPIPLGVDPRGREVTTTLMFAAGIIGAIPRMGKTFLLRLLLLAAALDPRVELHLHDFKGGVDLAPLRPVAHYYRSGDLAEDMAAQLADLKAIQKEVSRRTHVLRTQLDGDPRCPEGKVTDELASDKSLGLHPILVAIDETQVLFKNDEVGTEARKIVEDLVRRGPFMGVMVWLATQRPDDKSIPKSVSSNAGLRLALKVMDAGVNNMILGPGMYGAGYSATTFSTKDKGVAYLAGEGDDPVIVRTAYLDAPTAQTIADRARAARHAKGYLTGMAAGEEPADTDAATVLDHLLEVWPAGEDKEWSDVLADRLAEARPALYEGWTGRTLNAAVKPHGVPIGQRNRRLDGGKQKTKPALTRAHVTAALGDDETRED